MQKIDNKQPWEVYSIGVNFSNNLETGETVNESLSEVKVYEKTSGEDVTSTMIAGSISVVDTNTLVAVFQSGTDGVRYKASFRAYISATKKLEEDLEFKVVD